MMLRINAVGRISPEMHRLRGTLLSWQVFQANPVGERILVPPNSAGPDLQVLLPAAHPQGGGKSQVNVPQAR
jgi:hypothetical protein